MTDDMIGLDDFRQQVRVWLVTNMEPRTSSGGRRAAVEAKTKDEITEARRLQRKLFDGGYAGITVAREYGGAGLTAAHEHVFRSEAQAYVMPDLGAAGGVTHGPILQSLLAHGSPELRERHVPKILSGEEIWCQFYSEPEAGSDLAGVRTRAVRDGDRWILNGAKIWSSGADYSDYGMCLARTNPGATKHRGLTWFVVPTDAPGLTVRPIKQINAGGGFCEEFFDGVAVAADSVIGEVNQGWTVTQTMLVYERAVGEQAPVEPRRLAPDLVALARLVDRSGDPTARQAIARAHTNDFAQYHLFRQIAARMEASGTPDAAVAAYGKLAAGTYNPLRARLAFEVGGASALMWSPDDEDGGAPSANFLNARIPAIAGGTNEMQRNGIGERVLGLPREPSFDSNKPFSAVLRDSLNWTGKVPYIAPTGE